MRGYGAASPLNATERFAVAVPAVIDGALPVAIVTNPELAELGHPARLDVATVLEVLGIGGIVDVDESLLVGVVRVAREG